MLKDTSYEYLILKVLLLEAKNCILKDDMESSESVLKEAIVFCHQKFGKLLNENAKARK